MSQLPNIIEKTKSTPLFVCSSYFYLPGVLEKFQELPFEDQMRLGLLDKIDLPFTDDIPATRRFLEDLNQGNVQHLEAIEQPQISASDRVVATVQEKARQFRTLTKLLGTATVSNKMVEESSVDQTGTRLAERLRLHSEHGGLTSGEYEAICLEAVSYLFSPSLYGFETQSRTTDGAHRYDFICRIKPGDSFWDGLRTDFHTRSILFECKNYSCPITADQIYSTERYLLSGALRMVCFLISRKGPDDGCKNAAQGVFREARKLILLLSNDDLIKMLELKLTGSEPTMYLDEKIWKFTVALSR